MKLKSSLLYMILDNAMTSNRYSKAFLNIENVFKLESKDPDFVIPKELLNTFKELKKRYDSFLSEIPLLIIERYYFDHANDMNKFVYLEYDEKELSDIKIIDLYNELEQFYNEIFELACEFASYYNLEIKMNKGESSGSDYV